MARFGALAFGIGTSDVEHVMATQTLLMPKSKNMRVTVNGALPEGVTAKDIALAVIARIGTAGGTGYVIEYAGDAVMGLSMEGRMTLCNMTIEGGARAGLIAPDETTFAYIAGKPRAPEGRCLRSRGELLEDVEVRRRRDIRCQRSCSTRRDIVPMVTWGHLAGTGAARHRRCARSCGDSRRQAARRGGTRVGLHGPDARHETDRREDRPRFSSAPAPTDVSRTCAPAAEVAKGKKVAATVSAMVVPALPVW